jgi:citrate lyase alpha subunit
MASPNPWDPASEPNAAGLLLGQFVASGTVSQVRGGGDGVIKGVLAVATEFGCEVMVLAAGVVRGLVGGCCEGDRATARQQL